MRPGPTGEKTYLDLRLDVDPPSCLAIARK